jgi:hypothetical protein
VAILGILGRNAVRAVPGGSGIRARRAPSRHAAAAAISTIVTAALIITLGAAPAGATSPAEVESVPAAAPASAPAPQAPPAAPAVIHLRDAQVVIVQTLPRDEARAALDAVFAAEEQRIRDAQRQEQVRTVQAQQAAVHVEQVMAAQQAAQAQAAADAQLQEALAALAKALSTSQCTTVGGTNGQPASISCPMDDGDATISGDDNVDVVVDDDEEAEEGESLTASGLPDDPVGPESVLSA